MSEQALVLIPGRDPVPGLVLKWKSDRTQALVTLEVDGHVDTRWVPIEQLRLSDGPDRPDSPAG